MTTAEKYQVMLYKVENTEYTNEQLHELTQKLLEILINTEKANDEMFNLLSMAYQMKEAENERD